MTRLRLLLIVLAAAAACTEDVSAPGRCPDFCPGGQITVVDTMLTVIGRDSAFRGYVRPHEAATMIAADLPGLVDSRPIFRTNALPARILVGSDTTTGAILTLDSAQLRLVLTRRDTAAHNLTLQLSRLPLAMDTATTFAGVDAYFTDSLIHTVNLDSLVAHKKDPVTHDSVIVGSTQQLTLLLHLDTAQLHFAVGDSAKLGFGIRASADTLALFAVTAAEGGGPPLLIWYATVDSLGVPVKRTLSPRTSAFDTFVFDPPPVALDSTLAVGGAPSARSLLRIALPRGIRDSTQIIRATLLLVPAAPPPGAPIDSFVVSANGLLADFGGKSTIATDSARHGTARLYIGQTDTVRIDLTRLLRIWSLDTTAVTAVMLRLIPGQEGATFAEVRFQPSTNAAFRPALRVTYVPRFPFGVP